MSATAPLIWGNDEMSSEETMSEEYEQTEQQPIKENEELEQRIAAIEAKLAGNK